MDGTVVTSHPCALAVSHFTVATSQMSPVVSAPAVFRRGPVLADPGVTGLYPADTTRAPLQ